MRVLIGPSLFYRAVTVIGAIILMWMMVMTKSLGFIMLFTFTKYFQTIILFYLHRKEVDNADEILFFTDKALEAPKTDLVT